MICPTCQGEGVLLSENTRDITLLIAWSPADFYLKLAPVQIPAGMIQTKGFLSDAPYIMQSRRLVVETTVEPLQRYTFNLAGEPIDPGNIVQRRYCVCNWTRSAS